MRALPASRKSCLTGSVSGRTGLRASGNIGCYWLLGVRKYSGLTGYQAYENIRVLRVFGRK